MKKNQRIWLGALALSAGLIVGCQSGESDTPAPVVPPAGGDATAQSPDGPGMTPATPTLPVAPTGKGTPVVKAPLKVKTSFDDAPEGMPGAPPSTGVSAPDAAGGAAKPPPIRIGMASKFRTDPFVSFFQLVITDPPAYTLAAPVRLAAFPKEAPPPSDGSIENMLPLPPVPRRVAGVLYNGAITAILETGEAPSSDTRIIAPGARVPSGVPGVADLIVDSIAMDRLVLRAEDGRTVEVKLSGLSPAVLDAMRGQLGGGGGFGGAPGGFGGGGAPGGRGVGADAGA
jgi:hypothetical protein